MYQLLTPFALVASVIGVACVFTPIPALAQASGGSCSGSITANPDANGKVLKCNGSTWATVSGASAGAATETSYTTTARKQGIIYRNTTGKMLFVDILLTTSSANQTCLTDSAASPTTTIGFTNLSGTAQAFAFFVLNNNYYVYEGPVGSIYGWTEQTMPY